MKDIGTTLMNIAIVLVAVAASFFIGRWTKHAVIIETEVIKTDTLTVYDTVRIDRPVYIAQHIVDTLLVPVTDTTVIRDTAYISLPRTQMEYSDTTYRAWVSGYQPALDSICVYQQTKYVTTTVMQPKKHWHIGVSAGYGAALHDKQVILSPYLGIGVTYSIFSF